MNNLEIITAGFDAGETKQFALSGSYFEIIDATDPVDVFLLDRYGAQRGVMRQAEGSFHLRQSDFEQIQIVSATAQQIRFAYGSAEAGTRRTSGVVDVSNMPAVSGAMARLSANVGSGAVTTLAAANAARRYVLVQNNDAAIYLRLRVDGTDPTTAAGLRIPPGGAWESPAGFAPTGAIKVIAESGTVATEGLEG